LALLADSAAAIDQHDTRIDSVGAGAQSLDPRCEREHGWSATSVPVRVSCSRDRRLTTSNRLLLLAGNFG
jgi:hypothetical protein